jgi:hypothetical protein
MIRLHRLTPLWREQRYRICRSAPSPAPFLKGQVVHRTAKVSGCWPCYFELQREASKRDRSRRGRNRRRINADT